MLYRGSRRRASGAWLRYQGHSRTLPAASRRRCPGHFQATLRVFWPVPAPFIVSLAVYRRILLVGTSVWSLPDQQLSPLCGQVFEVWAALVSLCPALMLEPWVFVPCLLCTFFGWCYFGFKAFVYGPESERLHKPSMGSWLLPWPPRRELVTRRPPQSPCVFRPR